MAQSKLAKNVLKGRISKRAAGKAKAKIKALNGVKSGDDARDYGKDDLEKAGTKFELAFEHLFYSVELFEQAIARMEGFQGQDGYSDFPKEVQDEIIDKLDTILSRKGKYGAYRIAQNITHEFYNWDELGSEDTP